MKVREMASVFKRALAFLGGTSWCHPKQLAANCCRSCSPRRQVIALLAQVHRSVSETGPKQHVNESLTLFTTDLPT
jgi:hypothetical protein